jgi:poly(3-hydroxyalkanoate) synthetase
MMNIMDAIVNQNTVLILLGVGTIIWVIRQILPDKVEKSKGWKVVLRVLPVGLGVGLAMIPQLRPMTETAQSAIVGAVAGSLSATTYGLLRELMGNKIKLLMGSRATRKAKENGE